MKYLFLFLILSVQQTFAADDVEAKLDKLNNRISELELESKLNKIHFSGEFINRFETAKNLHGVPGSTQYSEKLDTFGMYFGLNTDFDISKNIKFYSTLSMSKFYNSEGRTENNNYDYANTERGGRAYAGATPKVDRAYATYMLDTTPLTLAVGRMATNGGPPLNQHDGLEREGTYPGFMLNAIFDGIAGIYNFSQYLPKDQTFKVRAFYQPFVTVSATDRSQQLHDGSKTPSLAPEYTILNEYSLNNTTAFDKLELMYMYMHWSRFYLGQVSNPATMGNTPNGQTEYGAEHGIFINFENIWHTGLNASWSGLHYLATDSATPDVHKSAWGHLFNLNEKFIFLSGYWQKVILGYEYITTEKYFYVDDWANLNLLPFYALQANTGNHVYVTFPVGDKFVGRLGYYTINAKAGDFVQPEATNAHSAYGQLRLDF